jgi:hypothetical protein
VRITNSNLTPVAVFGGPVFLDDEGRVGSLFECCLLISVRALVLSAPLMSMGSFDLRHLKLRQYFKIFSCGQTLFQSYCPRASVREITALVCPFEIISSKIEFEAIAMG